MAKIKVKDLEVGMVLTEDVHDQNGRFLLGTECELAEKHIKALRAWGVFTVQVEGADDHEGDSHCDIDPALVAAVESEVCERFRCAQRAHPLIQELYQEAIKREVLHRSGEVE